jgi:hypothetical protein
MLAATALAHHSTAIYDSEHLIELRGTVEWQFVNPHCFIVLEVTDEETRETKTWSLEGPNTADLFRRGWTPDTLKPGDEIMITVRPCGTSW